MMVIVPNMPTTPLATTVVDRLIGAYSAARDPMRAAPMRAYMRDRFAYLGLPAPRQLALNREVMAGVGSPDEADLSAIALRCWELDEREYQYFACRLLRRHSRALTESFLPVARRLITSKSWWDTVDEIAVHVVGPVAHVFPSLSARLDGWATDENKWIVRSAILHQIGYRDATDPIRLFHYCSIQAQHPDFFVRKAIGWALREYSKTDPVAVQNFVRAQHGRLSGLSAHEALRLIK